MSNSSGIVRAAGEGVGNFLAGIPPALIDFFSGIAAGAYFVPILKHIGSVDTPPGGASALEYCSLDGPSDQPIA